MAYEPVLDGSVIPSPRVRVSFPTLAAGTATVTVYRRVGRVETAVREAVRAFAAGGFTVVDWEAATGAPNTYRADMFDASGNPLGSTGITVTTIWGNTGWVWISDPLSPGNAIEVQMLESFGDSFKRGRETQKHSVSGETIALLGAKGLLEGVNLSVGTPSDEDTEMLRTILEASVILVRTMPGVALPRLLYALVPDFSEIPFNARMGGEYTTWAMSGDELTASVVSPAAPAYPYQTYMDAFATYAEAELAYAIYLDAMKNPPGA